MAERTRSFNATIIQQTFLDVTESVFGSYDRLVPGAPARVIKLLNDQLSRAAAQDGVLLLDVARASERDGIDAWFDTGSWLHGKLEIAPEAAPLCGDMIARIVAAQRGLSKKCLVFDLDNTLWGGVIGDDGLEGLVLGEGSAVGEAHLALQRYAKQLKERGVILAVCSKNDPAIAEAAFNEHPEMLLKRSDISAFVANWNDKAENLKAIAARLNIGLDSLVFVDDNPVERARIRQGLPLVAVPNCPRILPTTYATSPMRDISRRSPSPPRIDSVPTNMRLMPNAKPCLNYRETWTISCAVCRCQSYSGSLPQPISRASRNCSTKPISSTRRPSDTLRKR